MFSSVSPSIQVSARKVNTSLILMVKTPLLANGTGYAATSMAPHLASPTTPTASASPRVFMPLLNPLPTLRCNSLASPRLRHGPLHEQIVGPQLETSHSQRIPTALQRLGPLLLAFSPAGLGPRPSIRCDPWPAAILGCILKLTMGASCLVRSSQQTTRQGTERLYTECKSQEHRVPHLSRSRWY